MDRLTVPRARSIMTRSLTTLKPDMPAVDAAKILVDRAISGAPVVDSKGRLLGLLSEYDCLRVVASAEFEMDAHDAAETVADLMTRACHTASPEQDLFALAHSFVTLRVRRLPVVQDGVLLGQVSRRDALRAALELRRQLMKARRSYPDYPKGRDPIHNYPR